VVLLVYFVLIDKGGMKRTNKQKTRKENKTLEIRKETFVFVCVCVCLYLSSSLPFTSPLCSPLFEITREKRAYNKNKGDKMSNPSRQQKQLRRLRLDKDEGRKKEKPSFIQTL